MVKNRSSFGGLKDHLGPSGRALEGPRTRQALSGRPLRRLDVGQAFLGEASGLAPAFLKHIY